jgi:hypothetical protein
MALPIAALAIIPKDTSDANGEATKDTMTTPKRTEFVRGYNISDKSVLVFIEASPRVSAVNVRISI